MHVLLFPHMQCKPFGKRTLEKHRTKNSGKTTSNLQAWSESGEICRNYNHEDLLTALYVSNWKVLSPTIFLFNEGLIIHAEKATKFSKQSKNRAPMSMELSTLHWGTPQH